MIIRYRTVENVKKKRLNNLQIQENLEKKLDEKKDVAKWESILALTFEVIIQALYLSYF